METELWVCDLEMERARDGEQYLKRDFKLCQKGLSRLSLADYPLLWHPPPPPNPFNARIKMFPKTDNNIQDTHGKCTLSPSLSYRMSPGKDMGRPPEYRHAPSTTMATATRANGRRKAGSIMLSSQPSFEGPQRKPKLNYAMPTILDQTPLSFSLVLCLTLARRVSAVPAPQSLLRMYLLNPPWSS